MVLVPEKKAIYFLNKESKLIEDTINLRKKREIKDAKEITMKGKGGTERRAITGVCPVCGTKMFRFLPKA